MRALKVLFAIMVAALCFLEGMAWQIHRDVQYIKRINATVQENMLMLAAPLLECRSGRKWESMQVWQEIHEGCDLDCVLNLLLLQAEAENTETTVAER